MRWRNGGPIDTACCAFSSFYLHFCILGNIKLTFAVDWLVDAGIDNGEEDGGPVYP